MDDRRLRIKTYAMNTNAAPGGGSTINGVLYQLLWTLLRVSKVAILDLDTESSNSVSSAVVIAEPSDGGDVQIDSDHHEVCLLYTSPSPRDQRGSRMPSSA